MIAFPDEAGGDDTLFFAATPSEPERSATTETVMRLRTENDAVFQPRPSRVLHATMMKVGNFRVAQGRLNLVEQIAGLVRARAFVLTFDRLTTFGGGAMVLTCSTIPDEWRDLCRQLRTAPVKLGLQPAGGSSPHATFSYGATIPDAAVSPAVAWRVGSFALIRSHHGETRHTEIGRWPLKD